MAEATASILILDSSAQDFAVALADELTDTNYLATTSPDEAAERMPDATVVLGEPGLVAAWLPRATAVRWVQSTWAGVEPFVAPGTRRDFILTGVKEVFGPSMAEYVLAWLLAHEQRIVERRVAQDAMQWQETPAGTLRGRRAVLLGFGSIGRVVADLLVRLGVRVDAISRSAKSAPTSTTADDMAAVALHSIDQLPDLLKRADYLISLLPATPATTGLLNDAMFAAVQPGAVLVNAGRAGVIDDQALLRALRSGVLAQAVLDVTDPEPLPPAHPFWAEPGVQLTFHTAAPSHVADIAPLFAANLERWRAGQPLSHRVDFERGY